MKIPQKLGLLYYRTVINSLALVSKQAAAKKALTLFSTPLKRTSTPDTDWIRAAKTETVECKGLKLHCYRWNTESSRKLLIIHGFESAAGNYQHFIQPLTDKGYQVIAFDAQAHGNSEGTRITLFDFEENIRAIYNKYGPFNAYIAHSFGGLTLMHFCEQLPATPAPRIVLVAPATESVSAINRFFRMLKLNRRIRPRFDQLVEEKAGMKAEAISIRRSLDHIPFAVLWVHDRQDPITPFDDVAPIKNAAPPTVEFMITEGLGHRRIYRDAGVVNRITDFV